MKHLSTLIIDLVSENNTDDFLQINRTLVNCMLLDYSLSLEYNTTVINVEHLCVRVNTKEKENNKSSYSSSIALRDNRTILMCIVLGQTLQNSESLILGGIDLPREDWTSLSTTIVKGNQTECLNFN